MTLLLSGRRLPTSRPPFSLSCVSGLSSDRHRRVPPTGIPRPDQEEVPGWARPTACRRCGACGLRHDGRSGIGRRICRYWHQLAVRPGRRDQGGSWRCRGWCRQVVCETRCGNKSTAKDADAHANAHANADAGGQACSCQQGQGNGQAISSLQTLLCPAVRCQRKDRTSAVRSCPDAGCTGRCTGQAAPGRAAGPAGGMSARACQMAHRLGLPAPRAARSCASRGRWRRWSRMIALFATRADALASRVRASRISPRWRRS